MGDWSLYLGRGRDGAWGRVGGRQREGLEQFCDAEESSCGDADLLPCNTVMQLLLFGMTSQLGCVRHWKRPTTAFRKQQHNGKYIEFLQTTTLASAGAVMQPKSSRIHQHCVCRSRQTISRYLHTGRHMPCKFYVNSDAQSQQPPGMSALATGRRLVLHVSSSS